MIIKINKKFKKCTCASLELHYQLYLKLRTMQCVSKKSTNATLYCNNHGAPSRMVILTIRYLGLDIDLKYIDVFKGEQHTPEFIKINQLHQIPVLHTIEDSFILSESRAIIQYLASTSKSSLYPTDVKKRALVDSRLFFDASNVQIAVNNFVVIFFIQFKKKISNFSSSV
jgi:glutathione S-transferase